MGGFGFVCDASQTPFLKSWLHLMGNNISTKRDFTEDSYDELFTVQQVLFQTDTRTLIILPSSPIFKRYLETMDVPILIHMVKQLHKYRPKLAPSIHQFHSRLPVRFQLQDQVFMDEKGFFDEILTEEDKTPVYKGVFKAIFDDDLGEFLQISNNPQFDPNKRLHYKIFPPIIRTPTLVDLCVFLNSNTIMAYLLSTGCNFTEETPLYALAGNNQVAFTVFGVKIPDFSEDSNEIALLYRQFWFFEREPPSFSDDLRRLIEIASDEQIVVPKALFQQYGETRSYLLRLYRPELFKDIFLKIYGHYVDGPQQLVNSDVSDMLDILYDDESDAVDYVKYFARFLDTFGEQGLQKFLSALATGVGYRPKKFEQYVELYAALASYDNPKRPSINEHRYVFPPSFTSALMKRGIWISYTFFGYSSKVYILPFWNDMIAKLSLVDRRTMHQPRIDRLSDEELKKRHWEITPAMSHPAWVPIFGLSIFNDDLDAFIERLEIYRNQLHPIKDLVFQMRRSGVDCKIVSDTVLDLCAQYGSVRCFEYLLMNDGEPGTSGIQAAILGGNNQIIEYYMNLDDDIDRFSVAIDSAINCRRIDVIEWLLDNRDQFERSPLRINRISSSLPSSVLMRLRIACPNSYLPISSAKKL